MNFNSDDIYMHIFLNKKILTCYLDWFLLEKWNSSFLLLIYITSQKIISFLLMLFYCYFMCFLVECHTFSANWNLGMTLLTHCYNLCHFWNMADIDEHSLAAVESTKEHQDSTRQVLDPNSQSEAPVLTISGFDSSVLS